MDWIFDHFQFVLIVALALASWLKHRSEAKAAEAEARRELEEMTDHQDGYEPEPEWTVPQAPPPLARPATPPPLRADPAEIDATLKRQMELQERLKQIKDSKAATGSRVMKPAMPSVPVAAQRTSLRAALVDPAQTRRAVVLREILGPPVGLR